MKKLLFLLFLLPFMAVAQVSNGQEQGFDYGIKNNSSQQILTPDTLVTKGVDGTYGHTSAYRLPISNDTYASLQTKVPYTGATSNVNLGEFQLTASGFVKSGGLSTEYLKADGSVSTLTNPITGTGTTNALPKFTGASTLGNSNLSDNGTLVTSATDMSINGVKVGKGGGNVATNTVVGYQSLDSNTTGYQNVSIGYQSLKANTYGFYNTSIGSAAMFTNDTGVRNTAINSAALYYNVSGNDNLAIGRQNLFLNTTGSDNISFGTEGLYSNTTGNKNISIGSKSGRYIANKTTENTITNNSIFLGYRTSPLADNQTNQIVIGYDATGLGSNSTVIGNTSTTKTGIYGRLQLSNNTTLPTDDGVSALNINGGVKLNTSPTTSAGSYEILTRNTSTGVVEKVASSAFSEPYLVYTALISQSGTSAPTAIVLRNTTGATVTYGYTGVGTYTATFSSGVLTSNKTTTYLGNAATDGVMSSYVSSTTVANINTVGVNGGYAFKNSYLSSTLFEIRVYP